MLLIDWDNGAILNLTDDDEADEELAHRTVRTVAEVSEGPI